MTLHIASLIYQKHRPLRLFIFFGCLLFGLVFFSPNAALGEIITYNNGPLSLLGRASDYYPGSYRVGYFTPPDNSLFSKNNSSSGNAINLISGTISGDVYGGVGDASPATNNGVTISGGRVNGSVYGGLGAGVNVNRNIVRIGNATVVSTVYGGRIIFGSDDGNLFATYNTVYIDPGTTLYATANVYGAYTSMGGTYLQNNNVIINGGEIRGSIIAGAYNSVLNPLTLQANRVTINDGIIRGADIYGARAQGACTIAYNRVIINGGTINEGQSGRVIYGGQSLGIGSEGATVQDNQVTINAGNIWANVSGGSAYHPSCTATRNMVEINGGTIHGNVYGGVSRSATFTDVRYSTITGNSVTLAGGTVNGNIFAGHSNGTVTNNRVNLSGGTVTGTVYGTNHDTTGWEMAGNTLTAFSGVTSVGGINRFALATINNGATINVTGDAAYAATFNNLTNNGLLSFFNGSFDQDVARIMGTYTGTGQIGLDVLLGQGVAYRESADSIIFDRAPDTPVMLNLRVFPGSIPSPHEPLIKIARVDESGDPDIRFTTSEYGFGVYAYEILRSGNDYLLGLCDKRVGEIGKTYSKKAAAAGLAVALTTDTFLRNDLEYAVSATAGEGFGISSSLGYSSERIDTGSHVDIEGISGLVTLAFNPKGTPLAFGAFGEMFLGNYKTNHSFSTSNGGFTKRSSGGITNYGGGLFIQYRQKLAQALESDELPTWVTGPHAEAMVRVGHSKTDFKTDTNHPSTFEIGRVYHGASLGGGYVFEPFPKFGVDLYGHGIWTSLAEKGVRDNLGQNIQFERADSLRFVSGFRASYMADERLRPYVGVAKDWEVLGRPKVHINNQAADSADFSGVSVLFELGLTPKIGNNLFVDMKGTGTVGKRRGLGGLLELRYEF